MKLLRWFILSIGLVSWGCGSLTGFEAVAGEYELVQVNDRPLPFRITTSFAITSGWINIERDGSYTALTCYNQCTVSRREQGSIEIRPDNTIRLLSKDGYSRELTCRGGTMTQHGSGDLVDYKFFYVR